MSERTRARPDVAARSASRRKAARPGGVRLRRMEASDLPRVSEIESSSFSNPWKERTFRSLLPRSDAEMWVAESSPPDREPSREGEVGRAVGGRVVGYVVIWFAADEGELADLAVASADRGRGIGGRLVARAVERARDRGVRSLFLEVRASNDRATALYRSKGFRVISVRRRYYVKPREDALVMLKSLW